ncbi:MAG: sigma 54-interacting transcriptional regulator [Archangiaceae bacterium]|nr:sigma 54-interacting transcriptional regulator [Archangiaceae bacterium]
MSRPSSAPETTQTVNMPEEAARRVQVHEWSLEVVGGPDKGKKVSTLDGLLRVGGDTTNDLVLTDGTVSRRHIEVERVQGGLILRDLGSRNGTWIEGRRVVTAYVEPGDKIMLGKTKLAVKQQSRGTEIEVAGGETFGDMVGSSEAMRAVFSELRRTAKEDMNLLIEGETGTGKELAARAVHEHSGRRFGPFRVVDCSLLEPGNADKELFGPEGAFASAEGGTLFFDEIAEVPAPVQPKLLRVIDTKEMPTGTGKSKPTNIRIIASSARNLTEEIEQNRFRKDLYFRLAVGKVRLPPLRTRKADIPVIAQVLVKKLGTQVELSAQTLSLLEGYEWPGNVRELRNVLERGALMQQTGNSSWLDFLVQPEASKKGDGAASLVELVGGMLYHEAKDRVLADFERGYFAEIMKRANFDMKDAEARTGLSMQSLYRLLKKNGLRMKDLKNAEGLS